MMSRSVVAVVGMHRSGTSLTMQALGALGLTSGGGLLEANAFNPRGYWEAAEIVALHDRLLAALDRPWGSFQHMLPLPEGWQDSAAARRAEAEIEEVLEIRLAEGAAQDGGGIGIAIKDPRLSLFLPLWQRVADDLDIGWKTVLCLRNPWDVAQSLVRRDGIPPRAGEALWLLYTASVLAHARPEATMLSRFDDWTAAPDHALARLAAFIGQPLPSGSATVFEPGLVTATPPAGDALVNAWVQTLEAARSPEGSGPELTPALQARARDHLAHARHFQIWPDTLRDTGLAQDLSQALVRALDSMTAARDAEAAQARTLRKAYDTEAARAETLRSALTEAEGARDAQATRATDLLAAYQAEAARADDLRRALTEAEAARDAQATRATDLLAAYQAEAARADDLRRALTEAEDARDTQATRATDLLAAYQAEAARADNLRRALTEAEAARDAQATRATDLLAAYQAEAARAETLRRALTEAEAARDAQATRATDLLAAYQTEAARADTLRSALTAAEGERDAQAARAAELLTAYQTEAARAAELLVAYQTEAARAAALAARLARFDPRTWVGRKGS